MARGRNRAAPAKEPVAGGRAVRVAHRMQEELAAILPRLRDPRVIGAVVTRIEISDDLSFAKVYVRAGLVAEKPDDAGKRTFLKGLTSATPMVRREVAEALDLQKAPELRFIYDEGAEHATRVEEILREIADEDEGRKPDA
jgi:ribosome-binding factor A